MPDTPETPDGNPSGPAKGFGARRPSADGKLPGGDAMKGASKKIPGALGVGVNGASMAKKAVNDPGKAAADVALGKYGTRKDGSANVLGSVGKVAGAAASGAAGGNAAGKIAGGQVTGAIAAGLAEAGKKSNRKNILMLVGILMIPQLIFGLVFGAVIMSGFTSGLNKGATTEKDSAKVVDKSGLDPALQQIMFGAGQQEGVNWQELAAFYAYEQSFNCANGAVGTATDTTDPTNGAGGGAVTDPGPGDDSDAPATTTGKFVHPLAGKFTLSSPYGMRKHPITGVFKLHDGQDFGTGTSSPPIVAVGPGVVLRVGVTSWGGNMIYYSIDGEPGTVIQNEHMIRPSTLKAGDKVVAGTKLGNVGATGYATGNHLHFTVRKNGIDGPTIPPLPWMRDHGINPGISYTGEVTGSTGETGTAGAAGGDPVDCDPAEVGDPDDVADPDDPKGSDTPVRVTDPSASIHVSVVSFNTNHDNPVNTVANALESIRSAGGEIVGMQERNNPNLLRQLKSKIKPTWACTKALNKEPICWIGARYQAVAQDSILMAGPTRVEASNTAGPIVDNKYLSWVELKDRKTGALFVVMNDHKVPSVGHSGQFRDDAPLGVALYKKQLKVDIATANMLKDKTGGAPIVKTGDENMNDKPTPTPTAIAMASIDMYSSFRILGRNFPYGTHTDRLIDYVWSTTATLAPVSHRILDHYGSDHRAMMATLDNSPGAINHAQAVLAQPDAGGTPGDNDTDEEADDPTSQYITDYALDHDAVVQRYLETDVHAQDPANPTDDETRQAEKLTDALAASKSEPTRFVAHWLSDLIKGGTLKDFSDFSVGIQTNAEDQSKEINTGSDDAVNVRRAYIDAMSRLPAQGINPQVAEQIFDTALNWYLGKETNTFTGMVCAPAVPMVVGGPADTTTGGAAGGGMTVKSSTTGEVVTLNAKQLGYAATAAATASKYKITDQGQTIMFMVILQESRFKMYANTGSPASLAYPHDALGHDHTSVGLYQQLEGGAWGPLANLMDVEKSTEAFLGVGNTPGLLKKFPDQVYGDLGAAAQRVQVSAFGSLYSQWEDAAKQILGKSGGAECNSSGGENGEAATFQLNGKTIQIPAGGCTKCAIAALEMVKRSAATGGDLNYSWGGGNRNGPSMGIANAGYDDRHVFGFDCSGLSEYAWWQGAKKSVPSVAQPQYDYLKKRGKIVTSVKDLIVGDMVFFSSPGNVHHVAIYIGNGMIAQAATHSSDLNVASLNDGGYYEQNFFAGGHP